MRRTVLTFAVVVTLCVGVVAVGVGPADSDTSALLWDEERTDAAYNATSVNTTTGETKSNVCAGSACEDTNTSTNDTESIRFGSFASLSEQSARDRDYDSVVGMYRLAAAGSVDPHSAIDTGWTAREVGVPKGGQAR